MKYCFAGHILDTDTRSLTRDGQALRVEPQVFDLLLLLLRNAGRMVARDALIAEIWQGRIVSDAAISARIAAARKAVGDTGKAQAVIRTVARRGVMLVAEVRTEDSAAPAEGPVAGTVAAPTTQRIRFTADPEGRPIAWAVTGAGPPLFRLGHNSTHLEREWHTPAERMAFDRLAARHSLLRYDPVGFGMSDRSEPDIDFAVMADNALRAADAAGFDRFVAYSESGGVHVALNLAARHPDRVSRMAIVGGYARGRNKRGTTPPPATFHSMVNEGWAREGSGFPAAFLLPYFPEGPLDDLLEIGRNMVHASSSAMLLKMRDAIDAADHTGMLADVRCPTLMIHARHDGVHPLAEAQALAAGIPDAELLVLESANHVQLPGNAGFETYVAALLDFFGGAGD